MSRSRWFHDDAVAARDAAAQSVRAEVARDRRRANVRLARFLTHLEAHLFDPTYRVGDGIRVAGISDSNLSGQFRRRFGTPPTVYVQRHRLRVVRALLVGTGIPVDQVAELSGFPNRRVMTRAFRKRFGEPPTAYRNRPSTDRPSLLDEATAAMARAVRREATLTERLALVHRLLVASGVETSDADGTNDLPGALHADSIAQLELEACWRWLCRLPTAGQQTMVRSQSHHVPGLLDFLLDKSRTEGRGHRARGVEIAHLALSSLDTEHLDTPIDRTRLRADRARAYANLGRAQRLALDLQSAEENLSRGVVLANSIQVPKSVKAEVWDLLAALRWYQNRFEDARRLVGKAIRIYQRTNMERALAQALLTRALILIDSGLSSDAMTDIEMSLDLLQDRVHDQRLEVIALQGLAQANIDLGLYKRAKKIIHRADLLCSDFGIAGMEGFHAWSHGQASRKMGELTHAEKQLRAARLEFHRQNEPFFQASVEVELAVTLIQRGQPVAAMQALRSALPVFRELGKAREGLAASQLLVQALRSDVLDQAAGELLNHLDSLRHEPASLARLRVLATTVTGTDLSPL